MMDEIDGTLQVHFSISVPSSEFSTWSPARIAAFFAGIAKAEAAVRGEPETVERVSDRHGE